MAYYITYKYRIYPSQGQEEELIRTFGCCRFLFNQMLTDKISHYELNDTVIEYPVGIYKRDYRFLYAVDPLALHRGRAHPSPSTHAKPGGACQRDRDKGPQREVSWLECSP